MRNKKLITFDDNKTVYTFKLKTMKKITLLLAVLVFGYTNAQTPTIQWQKTLGGSRYDGAYSVQQTTDGGYVVAGYTYSPDGDITGKHNTSIKDAWVVKLDAKGTLQWQKALGGYNGNEYAFSVKQTKDGGYIVAGMAGSTDGDVIGNHGSNDSWLIKLDATGTIQWQKTLGGKSGDAAYSVLQTTDGGYFVVGTTDSIDGDVTGNHGGWDSWVVKLDTTGTLQWQKALGGSKYDYAQSVQQTIDGGYIVAGYTFSNDGDVKGNHSSNIDSWVVKLDVSGTLQWQKTIGGAEFDYAYSVQQTTDAGYIVAGYSNSTDGDVDGNHGVYDFLVVKLDATGILQWQKSFGGSSDDKAYSVQQTTDGGYIVAGYTASNDGDLTGNHAGDDYWLVKLDATGVLQWQKSIGGAGQDVANSVQQTADGGYIVAGYSNSPDGDVTGNHGSYDFWVVKLSPEALATESFLVNNIAIYPNPATTTITIEAGNNTIVDKVIITDVMGKIILQETQNTKTIAIENLAQGMYILNAYSGEQKMVSKFIKQ